MISTIFPNLLRFTLGICIYLAFENWSIKLDIETVGKCVREVCWRVLSKLHDLMTSIISNENSFIPTEDTASEWRIDLVRLRDYDIIFHVISMHRFDKHSTTTMMCNRQRKRNSYHWLKKAREKIETEGSSYVEKVNHRGLIISTNECEIQVDEQHITCNIGTS